MRLKLKTDCVTRLRAGNVFGSSRLKLDLNKRFYRKLNWELFHNTGAILVLFACF